MQEIHDLFVADGWSEEDFYLVYRAGQRYAATEVVCEHGVPQVLHIKMTTSFFRPDTDRCEACREAERIEEERQEEKTNAFLARLAARRKAAG